MKKQNNKPKNKSAPKDDYLLIREKGVNARGYGHVSKLIMSDSALSIGAKGLYAYLSSAAGSGEEAYLRRTRILGEMDIGQDGYDKYMNEMELLDYITRAQTRSEGGLFGVTAVEFVLIPKHLAEKIAETQKNEKKPTMYSGTIYALGFGTMPRLVARDSNLSARAKGLYAYIAAFASPDGEAFPGRDRILAELNISKNSYTQYLKELTDRGYITTVRIRSEDGTLSGNIFKINMFPDEAIKAKSEAKEPCPKNPPTVEAPCPKLPCTVLPCPENPPTVFNNTNTILPTITSLSLLDRLIDTWAQKTSLKLLQVVYEHDAMALEALSYIVDAVTEVFDTRKPRIQIGKEILLPKYAIQVLLQANSDSVYHIIERFLAHTGPVDNPKAYLLAALYNEILNPAEVKEADQM